MSSGPFPQPPYPGFPPPHVRPRRAVEMRPIVAAVLAVLAAAALVAGTFLPLYVQRLYSDGIVLETITVTPWQRTVDPLPGGLTGRFYEQTHVARLGIPLCLIAVGLLAAASVVVVRARREGAGGRTAMLAAVAAVVTSAFILAMGLDAQLSLNNINLSPSTFGSSEIGLGAWIIFGATVLALLAGLLTLGLGGHADSDATPPSGFVPPGRVYPETPQPHPYQGTLEPPPQHED